MAALLAQNLAPIMFLSMVLTLLLGYPIAFTLAANGIFFFIVGVELAPLSGGEINLSWPLLQALPSRVIQVMSNETLLAIPFFTFMGLVLERSGIAEDLLDTIGQLFGTVRGGLAYAVILVGALLAATTGVLAASVISMGLISLPIMLRYGYSRPLASGVIVASGSLAQLIPPSLVLIILADQLGRSVGDMYHAAFLPALTLVGLYILFVFLVTLFRPAALPGLPVEAVGFREPDGQRGIWQLALLVLFSGVVGYLLIGQTDFVRTSDIIVLTTSAASIVGVVSAVLNRWFGARRIGIPLALAAALAAIYLVIQGRAEIGWSILVEMLLAGSLYAIVAAIFERSTGVRLLSRMAEQVTFVLLPPLLLVFLVLGTIFLGIATPTEGGAMGAVGALILAAMKRVIDRAPDRFSVEMVRHAIYRTAVLSTFVIFVLLGARVWSLTFYGVNGHLWVEHLLASLPGGTIGFLIFANIVVFILAFFLDFFELAFIVVPLLAIAADGLGIDLVWFGIMLAVNMQTSFIHPPFGFALFYLRSVAPREPYRDPVSNRMMEPVTTGQIYWGALPFLLIQCIMVSLLIAFPSLAMHDDGNKNLRNQTDVQQELNTLPLSPFSDDTLGTPLFGEPRSGNKE